MKWKYFTQSLAKSVRRSSFACPSCGNRKSSVVDRKFIITTLRRCSNCELLFRAPTTSESENRSFYQVGYEQGFTTEIPSKQRLSQLIASEFKGSNKDYSAYINIIRALGIHAGQRLLDFGCSWGYGSWQLRNAGYDVQAFEVSSSRCAFARSELGLNAVETIECIDPPFDCFFSAHVIEHVPSVSRMLTFARRSLRLGGLFVAFTPNGSSLNRQLNPRLWHALWGFVHPQLIDERFCARTLSPDPYLLASRPFSATDIAAWDQKTPTQLSLTGDELLVVLKKCS